MLSSKRLFVLLLFITFFHQAYFSVFFMYPAMLRQQGYDFSTIGWLLSIFSIAATATRPFAGIITEKYGFRNTIVASSIAMFLASLPLLFLTDITLIMGTRLLMGITFSIAMVAVSSYQSLAVPVEKRGKLFGWIATAFVLPQVVLMPVWEYQVAKGFFTSYLGFPPLLAFLAAAGGLFLPRIPAAERQKAREETGNEDWGSWRELFALPPFWILLASIFMFGFVNSSTLQYMPALLNSRGLVASFFVMSNASMAIALRIFASNLLDRLDRRKAIGFAIMLMGFSMQFVLFSRSNSTLLLGGLFYGVGMGFGFPIILALMPDVIPPRLRPKGVSVAFLFIDIGFILSPVVIGYASSFIEFHRVLHSFGWLAAMIGPLLYFAGWRKIIRTSRN